MDRGVWQAIGPSVSDGAVINSLPANAGDVGLIPELGRFPGGENGNPLQGSCLENPMDKSLMCCNPWGRKEGDMTERTCTHTAF